MNPEMENPGYPACWMEDPQVREGWLGWGATELNNPEGYMARPVLVNPTAEEGWEEEDPEGGEGALAWVGTGALGPEGCWRPTRAAVWETASCSP